MKKLFLTLLLVLSLGIFIVGCSLTSTTTTTTDTDKEDTEMTDDTKTEVDSDIVGTWKQYSEDNNIEEEVTLTLSKDGSFELLEEVSSDSTGVTEMPLTGTYTVTDDELVLDFDEPEDVNEDDGDVAQTSKFTYKIDGDDLELTGTDGTVLTMKKAD